MDPDQVELLARTHGVLDWPVELNCSCLVLVANREVYHRLGHRCPAATSCPKVRAFAQGWLSSIRSLPIDSAKPSRGSTGPRSVQGVQKRLFDLRAER